MSLVLAALLIGIAVPRFTLPRLGVSSHLLALMQGLFLIVLGLVWDRLTLSATGRRAAFWLALYGCFAPLAANLLGAIWGAGGTLLPIAAGGVKGTPFEEQAIVVLLRTGGASQILAATLVLWALRLAPAPPAHPS
jgi:hydroxylaminobenzene mutase